MNLKQVNEACFAVNCQRHHLKQVFNLKIVETRHPTLLLPTRPHHQTSSHETPRIIAISQRHTHTAQHTHTHTHTRHTNKNTTQQQRDQHIGRTPTHTHSTHTHTHSTHKHKQTTKHKHPAP